MSSEQSSLISQLETGEPFGRPGAILQHGLTGKSADGRLSFGFVFRGIPFTITAQALQQKMEMVVSADLGVLPYTAEDPERRATVLAILQSAMRGLGGRVRLNTNQHIIFTEGFTFDGALTPSILLTRAVEVVLQAKPYLELISIISPPKQTKAA